MQFLQTTANFFRLPCKVRIHFQQRTACTLVTFLSFAFYASMASGRATGLHTLSPSFYPVANSYPNAGQ